MCNPRRSASEVKDDARWRVLRPQTLPHALEFPLHPTGFTGGRDPWCEYRVSGPSSPVEANGYRRACPRRGRSGAIGSVRATEFLTLTFHGHVAVIDLVEANFHTGSPRLIEL